MVTTTNLPPVLPAPIERLSLRLARGLSLRQVGAALGKPPSTILRWERGATPRGSDRAAYAALLEALRVGAL